MENVYSDNRVLSTQGFYFGCNVKEQSNFINITNALSYFPGLSLISGIFKIVIGFAYLSDLKVSGKAMMLRGLVEVLGAGSLFLISDFIITILRINQDLQNKPKMNDSQQDPEIVW